jgi:hypothetical protein
MAESGNSETVVSGMYISRITSDDDRTKSYDLSKVTYIDGLIVDTWELDKSYEGVSIENKDGSNKWFLNISSKISNTIGVIASNRESGVSILLSTNIFSFNRKVEKYKQLVEEDDGFFINVYRSMVKLSGEKIDPVFGIPKAGRLN